MALIDFDKFLASFITEIKKYQPITSYNIPGCIKKALKDQGLEYHDGKIVKNRIRVSAEAKENGYGESDDERIRKEIIAILQYKYENFSKDPKYCNAPQWIAWLENAKRQIEKQGEQNHSEQDLEMVAKPKFNIGDWITSDEPYINNDYRLCKVVGISDGCYTIQTINGLKGYNTFKGWESEYRLWSIEDAKEGDVLTDDYGIYIFDRFDEYDERCFLCMGAYQYSQKVFENKHMLCSVEVHPASREQRDLLFQKMHEEGYEWNAEKKEVMKIGQKPTEWKQENREELTEFENAMMHIGGSFFGENAGLDSNDTDTIKEQAELLLELAPKTEWSEEDERIYQSIIDDTVQENQLDDKQISWIKSLKLKRRNSL